MFKKWESLFSKYIQEGLTAEELKEMNELEKTLREESLNNPNWKEL
jgi:hypothetical protein